MRVPQRLENSLRWLFYEPRHFWLCASVCVGAIVVVVRQGGAEPTVRLVGLVLQLFGIVTIVWGIVGTRQFFGMQSPLKTFMQWLSRFPLRRRTMTCAVGEAVEADDALSARAHTAWPIDSTAPLEQRVSTLERNLPLIQERISNFQAEFDRTTQSLKDQLKFEEQHRLTLSQQLHSQLRTYGTSGLHISGIGAVWLFLGATFGTASVEISALLKDAQPFDRADTQRRSRLLPPSTHVAPLCAAHVKRWASGEGSVEISYLADHPEFITTLAPWGSNVGDQFSRKKRWKPIPPNSKLTNGMSSIFLMCTHVSTSMLSVPGVKVL